MGRFEIMFFNRMDYQKWKLPPLSAELAVKADNNYNWNQGAGTIADQFVIDSFLRSFYFNDSF